MNDRIFSQDEIDYILSFIDKSTDYCTKEEDYQFDEGVRKKLDTLKSEVTTKELVDELRKREGVDVFEVGSPDGKYYIRVEENNEVKFDEDSGPVIILKITD